MFDKTNSVHLVDVIFLETCPSLSVFYVKLEHYFKWYFKGTEAD